MTEPAKLLWLLAVLLALWLGGVSSAQAQAPRPEPHPSAKPGKVTYVAYRVSLVWTVTINGDTRAIRSNCRVPVKGLWRCTGRWPVAVEGRTTLMFRYGNKILRLLFPAL